MVDSARSLGILAILALFASGVAAQAPAAKPGADKATGRFPVTTQSALVIRGIPGQIVVTTKTAPELRFSSKAKDKSGSERPIAVEFGETTVTMTSPPGTALPDGILRVAAPASFSVRVEAQDGTVVVDGFAGSVGIVGKGTVVRVQALTGPLDAGVEGGSLNLNNLGGAVTARLGAKATFTASALRAGLDLNSRDATVKVQGLTGAIRLDARGGSADLTGLSSGGDVRMSDSALRLTGGKGELTVTSDAAVEFTNMNASMRFEMDGGSLHGKGNQGLVRVRGRRTDVKLEGIAGELDLDTTSGGVVVQKISGPVTAVVFGGDAQLLELQGAVDLDIGGGNAEVAWAAIAGDRDSRLRSNNGDLTVRFPANASCRVTARSSSGRITSDIPTIKVPAGATEVQGAIGPGQGPQIEIEAEGNIRLSTGAKAPPPASKGTEDKR
jgi:hypothetical protein